jgi:hypothetical protein
MGQSEMTYYNVLLRPKQGAIHTYTVEAEDAFKARQLALARFPQDTIIKIMPVSSQDL